MKQALITLLSLTFLFAPQVEAHQYRSNAAKREFRMQHPCPLTGQVRGRCPGYVIDHVKPLACGGEDHPNNMQWQTMAEAKEKDKWERKDCGR